MATIKDIAQACNVSKSTVSRYLNKSGYVSAEVTEILKAKIREFDYVPSAAARNLTTKKSSVVAVVIPEVNNPFFAEIFKGISQVADKHDLSLLYCDTDNSADKELKTLDMLRRYEIEGLILTPATGGLCDHGVSDEFVHSVKRLKAPVVLLDRDVPFTNWDGVFTDNFKGAFESTMALINGGHKRIATITGDMDLTIGRERFRGYREALLEKGLSFDPSLVFQGDFTIEKAYSLMLGVLKESHNFTALFSPNNLTTLGILKALFEKGHSVPSHIALTGFDDIELLNTLNVNLTVAARDTNRMGREAMKLLLEKMGEIEGKGQRKPKRIVLEPTIFFRDSEVLV